MNATDARAAAVAALDHAAATIAPHVVLLVSDAPVPPGFACWAIGDARVTLPRLRPDAPADAVRRYWARIVADATGTCPLCGAVASLTTDPMRTPAAWALLPVAITVRHAHGCRALFSEADRHLFDPEAAL